MGGLRQTTMQGAFASSAHGSLPTLLVGPSFFIESMALIQWL
jgi:hypothetical protein